MAVLRISICMVVVVAAAAAVAAGWGWSTIESNKKTKMVANE